MDVMVYHKVNGEYDRISLFEAMSKGFIKEDGHKLMPNKDTRICFSSGKLDVYGELLFIGDCVAINGSDHIVTYHLDLFEFGVVSRDLSNFVGFSKIYSFEISKIGNILTLPGILNINTINFLFNKKESNEDKRISLVSNYTLS